MCVAPSAHRVPFETVDGSDEANRELRNHLFTVSGTRGVYPLVFIQYTDGSYRYVGTWEIVQELNENNADSNSFVTAFAEVLPASDDGGATGAEAGNESADAVEGVAAGAGNVDAIEESPLPPDWVEAYAPDGRKYYGNRVTRVSHALCLDCL